VLNFVSTDSRIRSHRLSPSEARYITE
jgi:hypothetical protein